MAEEGQGERAGARAQGERLVLTPWFERLAWAGTLPFLAALVLCAARPVLSWPGFGERLALAYGAAVLSFVGAVHWGVAIAGNARNAGARLLVIAVLPSLLATAALVIGGQRGLALLIAGFGAFWLYEKHRCPGFLAADYLVLRRNLTLTVCGLLVLTLWLLERDSVA